MERSISGKGLRPTLNSYMYANAIAIAHISCWAGRPELQRKYQEKADSLREKILSLLWDSRDQFFKVIPMDSHYFKTPYGPATAERNHPYFMKPASDHECLWNGPVWPFATTQTLNSMICLLQNGSSNYINRADFMELLEAYARSHRRMREDGKTVNWLDENIDPDTGGCFPEKFLRDGTGVRIKAVMSLS